MTNEEAIKDIEENIIPIVGGVSLRMAIKALKQESVLDKIRAEINSPNRGTCDYFIVDRIEEIIDKYIEADKEVDDVRD